MVGSAPLTVVVGWALPTNFDAARWWAVPTLRMAESYHVRIEKAEHVFSAAHFITFGSTCERLHGHNYRVAAEFRGSLDENHLVIDFLLVRAKLREIVAQLDHYVLLPTQHPQMKVEDDGREVVAVLGDQRWIFPSGDCRLLPMPNTTAEMLAAHIGHQLIAALEEHGATLEFATLEHVRIEVDECDGQIAIWQR